MPKRVRIKKAYKKTVVTDIEGYRRQVNASMASGNYATAIEYLEKLVKIYPKDGITWSILGVAYRQLRDYRKAIGCFERALQLNPQNANTWMDLGVAYGNLGNIPKAIRSFEKAIQIAPQNPNSWNNLGAIYANAGDIQKAIACWEKALQIDPKFANAWTNLGAACLNSGQSQKALDCAEKAVRLEPKNTNAWMNVGAVHNNLRHYQEAVKCYKKALQLNPDLSDSILAILQDLEEHLGKTPRRQSVKGKAPQGRLGGKPKEKPKSEDEFTIDVKDPYEFFNRLGERLLQQYNISPSTDFGEITDIWKHLIKFLHPDSNPYASEELTKKLNEAYQKIRKERKL
jgi:tetratricopeptide (TPR) repeat protein